jgi:hypothetical protein
VDNGGEWIPATPDQWQFLRGISALNPETPSGLPFGDSAVIASKIGAQSGVIMFLDGGQLCGSMRAPKELLDMLKDVKSGKILHEGSPM